MWTADRKKNIVVLLLLLLSFYTNSSAAQRLSVDSPAVQDAGKSASPKSTGTLTPSPAVPEKTSVGDSQPVDGKNAPSIPGGTIRVLQEGEKLPQRKNDEYEDWSRPELTPAIKGNLEAIPMGRGERDGFEREIWRVQWRELDPIDLWVIKPPDVKNPPVILYLYSYDASNQRYKDDDFCRLLTRNGVAAVGFVSALTEQRFHDRPQRETFVSELQESLGTTTHDVQKILDFLELRGDMDMKRVGMWADGSGASIAIMASAVDARIKALDLLDPWGDWPDWMAKSSFVLEDQRAEYLKSVFLARVVDLDPVQYFAKVKAQKVRLQYIKDGISVTPATVREKMEAAAPSRAEIVHYENKKAFLSEVGAKGVGFDWIKAKVSVPNSQSETRDRAPTLLKEKGSEPR
jgi:hypothetical protein